MEIGVTFGELEAGLAEKHHIASDKRTQFQARLRKLQRLGIPAGVASGRGVAGRYGAAQIVETALALEFTELGLAPERVKRVREQGGYVIGVAIAMAAHSILEKPNVMAWLDRDEELLHMFLYFDPNALRALTNQEEEDWDWASASLFRDGAGNVRESIVQWSQGTGHLSLINVTVMMSTLAWMFEGEEREAFLNETLEWANMIQEEEVADHDPLVPATGDEDAAMLQVIRKDWHDSIVRVMSRPTSEPNSADLSLRAVLTQAGLAPQYVDYIDPQPEYRGVPVATINLPSDRSILATQLNPARWKTVNGANQALKLMLEMGPIKRINDNTVEWLIHYVPKNGVLTELLKEDPTLWERHAKHGILVAEPANLRAIAAAVASLWKVSTVTRVGWSDERTESLKQMWAKGMSASQIAEELGGVSRNAVIGKVYSMGLHRAKEPDDE